MGRIYHKVILSQTRRRRPFLGPGGVGGVVLFLRLSFMVRVNLVGVSQGSWGVKPSHGILRNTMVPTQLDIQIPRL